MSLTSSYLTSVKNFEGIMNSILGARAPERFTNKFRRQDLKVAMID